MEMPKFDSLKKFFKKSEGSEHLFHQRRDWAINIIGFLVVSVVVIAGSLFFYKLISTESIFNVPQVHKDGARTFDRKMLNSFSESMKNKQIEHSQIKDIPVTAFDPAS